MDNVEAEDRKDLAFLDEQIKSNKNIRGIELALGAIPAGVSLARLAQATQGYETGFVDTGGPGGTGFDPNAIFNLIKQLVDAEIQLFVQGFVTADQLVANVNRLITHDLIAGLGFVDTTFLNSTLKGIDYISSGQLIPQVDAEINRIVPGLIPAAQTITKDTINALYGGELALKSDVTALRGSVNSAISFLNNNFLNPLRNISILGVKPFSWVPLVPTI